MEDEKRSGKHKKNKALEAIFPEMEKLLGNAEKSILDQYNTPKKPVFLIVGVARSGSTLLYQYLAKSGLFGYPSNFMSRFYYAPYIGARIQQMLIDHDSKHEILGAQKEFDFTSILGKTKGPKQPHEFWYFWNRFFKFKDIQKISDEDWKNIDWQTFLRELDAMQQAFQLPLVLKAMNLNNHIAQLAQKSKQFVFIHIKRDTLYNAQSLLNARKDFFGNYDDWYSVKPENYYELIKKQPWEQVVNQVNDCNKAIQNQFQQVPENQKLTINYSDFCKNPVSILRSIKVKSNMNVQTNAQLPDQFELENKIKLEPGLWEKLEDYTLKKDQ